MEGASVLTFDCNVDAPRSPAFARPLVSAVFWSDGWCRKYLEVCWQPKGRDAECVRVAIRFARAFKCELLLKSPGCQTNAGLSVADSTRRGVGGVTAGETANPPNAELSHAGPDGVNCKLARDPGVALK
jgi:hypothetical protein